MLLPPGNAAASGSVFALLAPKSVTEVRKTMKEEAWIKKQLQEIEQLQRLILGQQTRIEDTFVSVRKESALALKKISDLDDAINGGTAYVSPELEQAIKVVSVRAVSLDKKVSDECSEGTTTKKKKGK